MAPRMLVTGAAGFVGANLVRRWTEQGYDVEAVVGPDSDPWRLLGSNDYHTVDLTSEAGVEALLTNVRPDVVVNAAAHGAYSSQSDTQRMIDVNVRFVERLVDWCCERSSALVHLGSSSEYGPKDHPPSELERTAPNSMYALTKNCGSHIVCDAVRRRHMAGVVLRLYSVYGPWEEPSRLMPTLAVGVASRRLPTRLVDPDVARDFVHVDDVVRCITAWIERRPVLEEPAILNVGSGTQTSMAELVALVRSHFHIAELPQWGTMRNRDWDTSSWVADVRRVASALGWQAQVELADGLSQLVSFVGTHRERYERID